MTVTDEVSIGSENVMTTFWLVGTPKVMSAGSVATMHGGAGGMSKLTVTFGRFCLNWSLIWLIAVLNASALEPEFHAMTLMVTGPAPAPAGAAAAGALVAGALVPAGDEVD